MPSARTWGTSQRLHSSSRCGLCKPTWIRRSALGSCGKSLSSNQGHPGVRSTARVLFSAKRNPRRSGGELTHRQPAGGSSRLRPNNVSLAVVMAACPPVIPATCLASVFAPWCPPNSGTTVWPSGDRQTTGGSAYLSASLGARMRMTAPVEAITTSARPASNPWARAFAKAPFSECSSRLQCSASSCAAMRWASAASGARRLRTNAFCGVITAGRRHRRCPADGPKPSRNRVPFPRSRRPAGPQPGWAGWRAQHTLPGLAIPWPPASA